MALRGSSQPPAMNRPKKLTVGDRERELRDQVAQVGARRARADGGGSHFRRSICDRVSPATGCGSCSALPSRNVSGAERAAGERIQKCGRRLIDGVATAFRMGDDLAVGRQVAHDVEVRRAGGRGRRARWTAAARQPRSSPRARPRAGAVQTQLPRQEFDALSLGSLPRWRSHPSRRE